MAITSVSAALGVGAVAAALGGWMRQALTRAEWVTASAAGLLLFYPTGWADTARVARFGATAVAQAVRTRRAGTGWQ